jgi:hypothetical protein
MNDTTHPSLTLEDSMNSYTQASQALLDQQRRQLETLIQPPPATPAEPSRVGQIAQRLGQKLMVWLTRNSEPRIRKLSRGGTDVWQVYDPMARQTLYFHHESEVRVWLDQRFYE